ncbi:MAG: hypothetical protein HXS43_08355 [Theionarchaea archaeon]|nr:hypothetical protein [Theionarchaea archaeon]
MKARKNGFLETYGLLRELSSRENSGIDSALLDRMMYNAEWLPPLGKEYWWFLFFGQDDGRPVQFMQLIFRKYGERMLFNNKEMILGEPWKNGFKAVTAGWIYDGHELHDLGDTNTSTEILEHEVITTISERVMRLAGHFPDYTLQVGEIIDLRITRGEHLITKEAYGVFLPPFGMGWINIYLDAHGTVLGRKFEGTAHLQKVVGASIFGPFHWSRVVFTNGSSVTLFCLKTGKNSKTYFRESLTFCDSEEGKIVKFNAPKLRILRKKDNWIVYGRDGEKELEIVLKIYGTKEYSMKGGGSQHYIEYVVVPQEFTLKAENKVTTLCDLGEGVGTFEDAYW